MKVIENYVAFLSWGFFRNMIGRREESKMIGVESEPKRNMERYIKKRGKWEDSYHFILTYWWEMRKEGR